MTSLGVVHKLCRLSILQQGGGVQPERRFTKYRDVDGISQSRNIPRLSRDQNIPGLEIPGVWLSRNPGIFSPGILNPGKSRNKKSQDFLFPKIPEFFKEVPGYLGIFFSFFLSNLLCLVNTKSKKKRERSKSTMWSIIA